MKIGDLPIGHPHPCRAIAEMSNAHGGSLDRAHRIIDAAQDAGADVMKLQSYSPDDLVALRGDGPAPDPWGSDGWTMRQLYEKAQTPLAWLPELVAHCGDVGLPWFSSVFGPDGLAALEALDCPAYKVAALDHDVRALRGAVLATGKPVVASTHVSGGPAVQWADVLLHCPVGYPQDPHAIDFNTIRLGGYDGLSYHGTNPFVPVYAASVGAYVVECHFQLDDEPSELEANVSLSASQFKRMVEMIRTVERVC